MIDLKIKEIKSKRIYKKYGYYIQHEIVDATEYGCYDELPMKHYYLLDNTWISALTARLIRKYNLTKVHSPTGGNPCIGFNELEQKWYGWSHRACYGFCIGSTVKKGDCAYIPATPQELYVDWLAWSDFNKPENIKILKNGIQIRHEYCYTKETISDTGLDILVKDETKPIEYTYQEIACGNGEWVANSLDDAKQMAIDFAKGVS